MANRYGLSSGEAETATTATSARCSWPFCAIETGTNERKMAQRERKVRRYIPRGKCRHRRDTRLLNDYFPFRGNEGIVIGCGRDAANTLRSKD